MDNNDKRIKSVKDVIDNLALIIQRAQSGAHVKDKFLRTVPEFAVAYIYRKGLKKILRGFEKTLVKCQEDYLQAIEDGSNIFKSMIIYAEFYQCYKFYKDEINLVTDLMRDYHYYVFDGRVIKSLMGYKRPEEDLVPYTKHGREEYGK